ncbi:hypothetical protein Y032_0045g1258 [Ancylostoma ceylanicum]|uniref:Uncharacterized protein n=1 Tax=Ancylostoma ceylanicum TaxID=53326 RepID=A0A016UD77_9BILA|nr:hypothetical protein Y032_0045g1258 [Ancylostoma ceylanicum]
MLRLIRDDLELYSNEFAKGERLTDEMKASRLEKCREMMTLARGGCGDSFGRIECYGYGVGLSPRLGTCSRQKESTGVLWDQSSAFLDEGCLAIKLTQSQPSGFRCLIYLGAKRSDTERKTGVEVVVDQSSASSKAKRVVHEDDDEA